MLLPGSVVGEGAHADAVDAFGSEDGTPVGLVAIDVEGPREPTLVVIGDSITEGYVGYAGTTTGTRGATAPRSRRE